CQRDIGKFCQSEIIDQDSDDKDSDEDDGDNDDKDTDKKDDPNPSPNTDENGDVKDREMGGRIIQCLRSKYA
ncbi:unnamed protein product, partial [Rotaria socialis]